MTKKQKAISAMFADMTPMTREEWHGFEKSPIVTWRAIWFFVDRFERYLLSSKELALPMMKRFELLGERMNRIIPECQRIANVIPKRDIF